MERFCFEKAGKFVGRGGTRSCEARFPSPHPTPPDTPLCYALECVNLSAQPDAANTAAYRYLPIHYPIPQRRTATCPERGSARGKSGLRNSERLSPSQTCPRQSVPQKGKPHAKVSPRKGNPMPKCPPERETPLPKCPPERETPLPKCPPERETCPRQSVPPGKETPSASSVRQTPDIVQYLVQFSHYFYQ